jgi:hypothetical protein
LAAWRVNGRDVAGADAEIVADQDLAIEPIWRPDSPVVGETIPPTQ